MVQQVKTHAEFKTQISLPGKVVFVDVFAPWCGPCKVIAPVFEKLSKEFPNCIFIKVDADEVEAVSEEYDVSALPTFLVFKEGEKKGSMTGASAEGLEEFVKKHAA